jgi:hypothetical protein
MPATVGSRVLGGVLAHARIQLDRHVCLLEITGTTPALT